MDAPAPDRPDQRPDFVSRRQLLWLGGSVGLASTVGACSSDPRMDSVSASATGLRPPSPNLAATGATNANLTTNPPSGPTASAPPAPSTTSARLLCRDAWGAPPARPRGRLHSLTP